MTADTGLPALELFGRDPERVRLDALVRAAHKGRGGTVRVIGEPGVGKTSLVRRLAADHPDLVTLSVTATEAEREVPFAALGILCASAVRQGIGAASSVLDDVVAGRVGGLTPLTAGTALLTAFAGLTRRSPVLLVVDDAQWLDDESALALAFALRRSGDDPVVGVLAARPGPSAAFDSAGFPVLELEGIDAAATQQLLGPSTSHSVAEHCRRATAGNPLALIEVRRRLDDRQLRGVAALPTLLPVGGALVDLLAQRLDGLAESTLDGAATLVATLDDGAATATAALRARGMDGSVIAELERVGVLAVVDGRVEFVHPLVRQAVALRVGPARLRTAHRDAAELAGDDPSRRVRHLAAAAIGPDDALAAELAGIAEAEAARSAMVNAARAWERAAALSPSLDDADRLLVAAGTAWSRAVHADRAVRCVEPVVQRAKDPLLRADAATLVGDMLGWSDVAAGIAMLRDHAGLVEQIDPGRAAILLIHAAQHSGLAGRRDESRWFAERSAELAEVADPALAVAARGIRGMARQRHGDRTGAEEDLRIGQLLVGLPDELLPASTLPILHAVSITEMLQERWDELARSLDYTEARARGAGLANTLNFVTALRGEMLIRTGRLLQASVVALDETLFDTGEPPAPSFEHAVLARARAFVGRSDDAVALATRVLDRAAITGMALMDSFARSAIGHVALTGGEPERAADELLRIHAVYDGHGDPGELWYQGDLLDALIALGSHDEAEQLARDLTTTSASAGSRWGTAVALRASGRLRNDAAALRASVDLFAAMGAPAEQARSFVELGAVLGDPATVERGVAALSDFGAAPLARHLRQRIADGGMVVRAQVAPDLDLGQVLTNAELRVAMALANGLSNREIADQLYLSPRTVESHLSNVYRKLGLRRRSELVARLARYVAA